MADLDQSVRRRLVFRRGRPLLVTLRDGPNGSKSVVVRPVWSAVGAAVRDLTLRGRSV
jgi:hypothetical protein